LCIIRPPFNYKTILHLNTKVFFQVHPALQAFFTARFAQDAKFAKKRYIFSAFVFLSFKGKQKGSKLGVLGVFAVNSIHTKTLLGSPSKPPFLGVVIDFHAQGFGLRFHSQNVINFTL
jgi:hypothetical protein